MKNRRVVLVMVGVVCFLGGTMIPSARTEPQAPAKPQPPKYYIVNCMKAKPGKYQQSLQSEREWKRIEEAYINAGKRGAWAVYGYQFDPGTDARCDYITVDGFDKWADLEDPYPDFQNVFKKIYPNKNFQDFLQQTGDSHVIAHQDVMVLIDHAE
jgi:hypothetical protein